MVKIPLRGARDHAISTLVLGFLREHEGILAWFHNIPNKCLKPQRLKFAGCTQKLLICSSSICIVVNQIHSFMMFDCSSHCFCLPYSVHDVHNKSCISTCSLHYVLVIHGFSWLDPPNFSMTGPLQRKKPGLCRSGKGLRTSCLRNITCARADAKRGVDRTKQLRLSVGL